METEPNTPSESGDDEQPEAPAEKDKADEQKQPEARWGETKYGNGTVYG